MGSHELAAAPAPGDEVTAALDALRRVVRALRLASTAVEKALGVSGAQLFVLGELEGGGSFSIAELAARTSTDPSSVSVVVARLVERGLAARRASESDARRAEVAITRAGRALLRRSPPPIQAKLIEALAALPPAELAAVAAGLGRVAVAVGAAEGAAPMFFEDDAPRPRRAKERAR